MTVILWSWQEHHNYIREYPIFRKYTSKCLGVKGHDAFNSSGSGKLCTHGEGKKESTVINKRYVDVFVFVSVYFGVNSKFFLNKI